ncbi:Zn 2cys6 transcription factor [Colletotrichum higginsianum IMI 349063]|uniref:Zn 2cys6 transcription factor n=1 Tax=Colletotrichum higginsianum (strain IMI 349063) TaxID=759273 RepID=A0A1B7YH38_COLHI|nr:Zn 2cys6 transcription factor [Colletotrichum higginsianum IMI 349063]OBR11387.1 Zn 2cys6 transcription factor [Colletotrichum higginsianum IMI 349063]
MNWDIRILKTSGGYKPDMAMSTSSYRGSLSATPDPSSKSHKATGGASSLSSPSPSSSSRKRKRKIKIETDNEDAMPAQAAVKARSANARKVKCSGEQPCRNCSRNNLDCEFGDGRKRYSEAWVDSEIGLLQSWP